MQKEIRFGEACLTLESRASLKIEPENCLCCNDEIIFIEPIYSLHTLRLFQQALRLLTSAASEVDRHEGTPIPTEAIEGLCQQIRVLNATADLAIPFVVWSFKPEKRGSPELPAGIAACLEFVSFADECVMLLEGGMDLGQYAGTIITVGNEVTNTICDALMGDERLRVAAVSADEAEHGHIELARLTCEADKIRQSVKTPEYGVTLRDVALFLTDFDEHEAKKEVKQMIGNKTIKASRIGKCPLDSRAVLYRLSEIFDDIVREYNFEPSRKSKFHRYLESKRRFPAP